MKNIALIFAGGSGQRMGADIPKQFLKVCGKDIIIHTLEIFEKNERIDEIYVVCIQNWINYLENMIKKFEISKVVKIIPGGINGQDSIYQGLNAIKSDNENCVVLIHDGVRPLVTEETINKCISSVEKYNSAITTTPCFETPIVSFDGEYVSEMRDRSVTYTAQAPQCFWLDDIYRIHNEERKNGNNYESIVDSCTLMNKYGVKCHMIEGNRGNIKVTTIEDLFNLISNYNSRDYEFLIELNDKKLKR